MIQAASEVKTIETAAAEFSTHSKCVGLKRVSLPHEENDYISVQKSSSGYCIVECLLLKSCQLYCILWPLSSKSKELIVQDNNSMLSLNFIIWIIVIVLFEHWFFWGKITDLVDLFTSRYCTLIMYMNRKAGPRSLLNMATWMSPYFFTADSVSIVTHTLSTSINCCSIEFQRFFCPDISLRSIYHK